LVFTVAEYTVSYLPQENVYFDKKSGYLVKTEMRVKCCENSYILKSSTNKFYSFASTQSRK